MIPYVIKCFVGKSNTFVLDQTNQTDRDSLLALGILCDMTREVASKVAGNFKVREMDEQ